MLRRTFGASLVLGLGGVVAWGTPPEGPPYFDGDRGISTQADDARDADNAVESGQASLEQIVQWLADPSVNVRDRVFDAVVERDDPDMFRALRGALRARDPWVVSAVAELYGEAGYADAREDLEALVRSREEDIALEAIWALEKLGSAESAEALEEGFERGRTYRVKGDSLIALATLAPEAAGEAIEEALEAREGAVRIAGLEALRRVDAQEAAEAAAGVIEDGELRGRESVWQNRLLFAALDAVHGWHARAGHKDLAVRLIDAMIERMGDAEGLAQHKLNLCLGDLSGQGPLIPEQDIWQNWWDVAKDRYEPVDKPEESEDEDSEDGVETGGATRVRFHGIPIYSNRLVFSQDISGGMNNPLDSDDDDSPSKMKFSKDELIRVLGALDDEVGTNIVFFATGFYKPSDTLLPLGRARRQLVQFIRDQQTPGNPMARSNLYDTLYFCMSDPEIDTVFFLSEGGPNEGRYMDRDRFLRHLTRLNVYTRVQIHCLQVSTSRAGARFLEAVSEATGGSFYDLETIRRAH